MSLIQVPLQQRQVPEHLFSARGPLCGKKAQQHDRKQGGGGAGGPGGAGAGAEEGAGAGSEEGAGAGTSKTAPISTSGAGDAARLRSLLAPAARSAGKDTTTRPKNTEPEAYLPLPCVFSHLPGLRELHRWRVSNLGVRFSSKLHKGARVVNAWRCCCCVNKQQKQQASEEKKRRVLGGSSGRLILVYGAPLYP